MKKTEDIIFALGMIAFILAVCGYDEIGRAHV